MIESPLRMLEKIDLLCAGACTDAVLKAFATLLAVLIFRSLPQFSAPLRLSAACFFFASSKMGVRYSSTFAMPTLLEARASSRAVSPSFDVTNRSATLVTCPPSCSSLHTGADPPSAANMKAVQPLVAHMDTVAPLESKRSTDACAPLAAAIMSAVRPFWSV